MNYVVLCPIEHPTEVVTGNLIGGNFVKGPSGQVYIAGFGPHTAQNSHTHVNLEAGEDLAAHVLEAASQGKSVAISGIDDPEAFMAAYGLVRCDKDGNVFTGGEE